MPSYAKNKKAYHDYEVLESYEAGIVLNGDEVKAIKNGRSNLKGAYVEIIESEAFMRDAHVSRYEFSCRLNHDPARRRKLLLNRREIAKIETALNTAGVTAVPLELYSKKGLIKLKVGVCRGKKLYDKRETLKRRTQERDVRRSMASIY